MLEPKGKHSQGQQKDLHQLSWKEVKHKDRSPSACTTSN